MFSVSINLIHALQPYFFPFHFRSFIVISFKRKTADNIQKNLMHERVKENYKDILDLKEEENNGKPDAQPR